MVVMPPLYPPLFAVLCWRARLNRSKVDRGLVVVYKLAWFTKFATARTTGSLGGTQRAEMEICAVSSTDVSTRTSDADAPPINVPLDDDDAPAAIEEARRRCSQLAY